MADRYTPKSKIAKLKRELEELDQKVQECTTDRPTGQPRIQTDRADKRRVSLLVGRQLETLKETEAEDISRKQSEFAAYQARRQRLISLIASENSALTSLQSQFHDSKRRLDSSISKIETQTRICQAKRKRDLQAIEKQLAALIHRKTGLSSQAVAAKATFETREEGRVMCCEELWGWERLHEEFVAEREEAEERMADFQRDHAGRDVSQLIQALYSSHIKTRTESKKSALLSRLEISDQRLSTVTKDCFILSSERQSLLSRLGALTDPRINSTLRTLEAKIEGDWGKLEEVIIGMNAEAGFDIDEQILRMQVEVVEERVAALEKEYMLDSTDLEERILESQDEVDLTSADPHCSKSSRLRLQASDLKRTQMNRLAAISQWKSEALSLLRTKVTPDPRPVSDELVVDELHIRLKAEKKGLVEKSVLEYAQLLKSKEDRMQGSEYHSVRVRLTEVQRELKQRNEWKTALQLDKGRARAELKEIAICEKMADAVGLDETHPQLKKANMLVERVTFWDELATNATCRLKSLLILYRELETHSREEKHRLELLLRDIDNCESQIKETQTGIQGLGEPISSDIGGGEITQMKGALTELSSAMAQSTEKIEILTSELSHLDSDWQSSVSQYEADRQALRRSGLSNSRSDFDLPMLEEIGEDGPGSKETREDSEEIPVYKLETSVRSSSELHGTTRSRSLLRMSVPRMPSKSPIDSREEDLMDLLDLDDDLDLLLDSQCAPPPKRLLPENISQSDREFFEKVLPLLDGGEIYKKYSKTNSLKQKAFDPLMVIEYPPDVCGFGLRTFRLKRNLREIDVKQGLKGLVESTITIDQIHAPMIPQSTMSILKTQKKLIKRKPPTKTHIENLNLRYKEMKEGGFVNVNSQIYEEKCRDCSMYPFSIVLAQSGRVEIVAPTYYTFKTWVNGLNALVKRKPELPELSLRVPTSRRWV